MAEQASLKATVSGLVQGVSFRAFTAQHARHLGLTGYTRNLPSGQVAIYAEGSKAQLVQFLEYVKEGPPAARVEDVVTEWGAWTGSYTDFQVTR